MTRLLNAPATVAEEKKTATLVPSSVRLYQLETVLSRFKHIDASLAPTKKGRRRRQDTGQFQRVQELYVTLLFEDFKLVYGMKYSHL